MRIPNMSKVRGKVDERQYDVKKIENYYEADKVCYDISDDKNKVKFVKYIETLVRRSFEYKQMIKFLREHIKMNKCSYFNKVNNTIRGITIEIHHDPFSLHDVTYIIMEKFLEESIPLDPLVISEQVMLLHYYGLVGLIPLSKTVHELVHASQIFVPITHVYGNVSDFYYQYKKYMTEHQKEILLKSVRITDELSTTPPKVLNKQFVYLDVDGMTLPHYVKKEKK